MIEDPGTARRSQSLADAGDDAETAETVRKVGAPSPAYWGLASYVSASNIDNGLESVLHRSAAVRQDAPDADDNDLRQAPFLKAQVDLPALTTAKSTAKIIDRLAKCEILENVSVVDSAHDSEAGYTTARYNHNDMDMFSKASSAFAPLRSGRRGKQINGGNMDDVYDGALFTECRRDEERPEVQSPCLSSLSMHTIWVAPKVLSGVLTLHSVWRRRVGVGGHVVLQLSPPSPCLSVLDVYMGCLPSTQLRLSRDRLGYKFVMVVLLLGASIPRSLYDKMAGLSSLDGCLRIEGSFRFIPAYVVVDERLEWPSTHPS
ncbi:hypothetical protein CYLTODRAFT_445798 [Cylindrobasidium torrendii FP15055 ss-10]|uniref:Uncharacterized protein n=1 Tax=Cylindrobasidium torrendii FP15055 ss-10 TaxID=1314674 RepID=A0A0D7B3J7_9AGAR|nr:hypothetical protein CYLTODRAFT_445798 [Cylindrobasidium torrendii FP15055 ss-10]